MDESSCTVLLSELGWRSKGIEPATLFSEAEHRCQ